MSTTRHRIERLERLTDASLCPHLPPRVVWVGECDDNRECPCGRERLTIKVVEVEQPLPDWMNKELIP